MQHSMTRIPLNSPIKCIICLEYICNVCYTRCSNIWCYQNMCNSCNRSMLPEIVNFPIALNENINRCSEDYLLDPITKKLIEPAPTGHKWDWECSYDCGINYLIRTNYTDRDDIEYIHINRQLTILHKIHALKELTKHLNDDVKLIVTNYIDEQLDDIFYKFYGGLLCFFILNKYITFYKCLSLIQCS